MRQNIKDVIWIIAVLAILGLFISIAYGCTKQIDQTFAEIAAKQREEKQTFINSCIQDHKRYECERLFKEYNAI
jgi:hypothetical protein